VYVYHLAYYIPEAALEAVLTDPVGLVDTATAAVDLAVTVTDPVGLGDVNTGEVGWAATITDSVGVVDLPGAESGSAVTLTDSVGVADVVTAAGASTRTSTDPVGVTDLARPSATYYVSPTGNDTNDGTSTATAWQTVAKVNATTFVRGDSVLFQGGQTFTGTMLYLETTKAGTATAPVTFGSYGTGRATISNTTNAAIFLYNIGGVVIKDLILTTAPTRDVVSLYKDTTGRSSYIRIDNIDCSLGKYGLVIGGDGGGGFDDLQVTNSVFHNNRDSGLNIYGPTYNAASPAWANSDITVSGCTAHTNLGNSANTTSNTGSGIVLGSVDVGLIELCTAYGNGNSHGATVEGPVGIWCYDARNVTIRRSTSYNNNTGTTVDGGGFDIDINCNSCVVERCVSYGNEGPGILVYGPTNNTAHTGNKVRDCLVWGNATGTATIYGEIKILGNVDQLDVYNNTMVATGAKAVVDMNVDTAGLARLRSNVFVARGTGPVVRTRSVAGISEALFQGNVYHQAGTGVLINWNGVTYSTLAAWRAAVTGQEVVSGGNTGFVGDPGLVAPATTPAVTDPAVLTPADGLQLSTSSAVAKTGLDLAATFGMTVGLDFFGGTRTSLFSVGAHEQNASALVVTDSVGLVDTVTATTDLAVTVTDPATATDSAAADVGHNRTVTDPAGTVAEATGVTVTTRTSTDPVGVTDAAGSGATGSVTVTDTVGATDITTTAAAVSRDLTEPVGVTGPAGVTGAATRTATDPVGVTDARVSGLGWERTRTEAVGLLDSRTTVVEWRRDLTEPVGATDTTTTAAASARTQTDPVGITDLSGSGAINTVNITDTVAAADLANASSDANRDVTDPVGPVDAAGTAVAAALALTDTATVADALTADVAHVRGTTDLVGTVDTVATGTAAAHQQTLTEAVGITDPATVETVSTRTSTDPVGVTDLAVVGVVNGVTVTDPVGLGDPTGTASIGARTVTDPTGATDPVSVATAYTRTATDPVALVDAVTTGTATAHQRDLTDPVGAVDLTSPTVAATRAVTDTVGAGDATALTSGWAVTLTDPVGLLNPVGLEGNYHRGVTDPLALLDAIEFGGLVAGWPPTVTGPRGEPLLVAGARGEPLLQATVG